MSGSSSKGPLDAVPRQAISQTVLDSGISQVYWCSPARGEFRFEPASLRLGGPVREAGGVTAWFDELFEPGLEVPEIGMAAGRALTVLLTGPPGSGKSTLAMELCYRRARPSPGLPSARPKREAERWSSLYLTTESTFVQIRDKARRFNWPFYDDVFVDLRDVPAKQPRPAVAIWETTGLRDLVRYRLPQPYPLIIDSVQRLMGFPDVKLSDAAADLLRKLRSTVVHRPVRIHKPDILVIDSLNTIPEVDRPDLFQRFVKLASTEHGIRLLIIVLDSGTDEPHSDFWEYVSDVVIDIGRKYESDYMIRTIEIKKARYQSHVWGRHQLKIYGGADQDRMAPHQRQRAHPFREEGGIAIFPSIHFYLSRYKRMAPVGAPKLVPTPLPKLNEILHGGGGLPKGRCTAFVGGRGGHKSHLAYLQLLGRLLQSDSVEQEGGIVISLRDDEAMARRTMEKIIAQHGFIDPGGPDGAGSALKRLIDSGRLEILYYPPGYITPEEFYHRMLLSVQRMMDGFGESGGHVTLLFNSLDQLSSRFPLCAEEKIFVPGIIGTLVAEEITSIFIAVDEPDQPKQQFGLLSMADLILAFRHQLFSCDEYCECLRRRLEGKPGPIIDAILERIRAQIPSSYSTIMLSVERYAGGQAAGASGILELVDGQSPAREVYGADGLFFTPLPGSAG